MAKVHGESCISKEASERGVDRCIPILAVSQWIVRGVKWVQGQSQDHFQLVECKSRSFGSMISIDYMTR